MSNNSTNYAGLNVTNDDMKEMLAEGTSAKPAKAAPAKKKNVGYRILALILTIAPIACLCLLSVNLLVATQKGYAFYDKATLLDAFLALFKKNGLAEFYAEAGKTVTGVAASGFDSFKIFGLPVLSGSGMVGKLAGLALYAFPAVWVLTLIFMIVALCSGKKAPAMTRAIALLNLWLYGGYAALILTVSAYYASIPATFDIIILSIAGAFFLFYFILSAIKAGKTAWMSLLLCLLTIAFAGAFIYGITECAPKLPALFASKKIYKTIVAAALGVMALALAISSIRMTTKKGYTFDLLRYLLNLAIAIAAIVLTFIVKEFDKLLIYAIIAAAVALVQVILVLIVLSAKKKAKKAKKEAPAAVEEKKEETAVVEAPEAQPVTAEEFAAEEKAEAEEAAAEAAVYAEAVRYEAAEAPEAQPITAEEIAKANEQPTPAATAYDPFIATLTAEEREQFTEIFLLKYKGETKNLPDYKVGGDNSDFFRKVFIYLGIYRDKIPDSLLAKMYQFTVKK